MEHLGILYTYSYEIRLVSTFRLKHPGRLDISMWQGKPRSVNIRKIKHDHFFYKYQHISFHIIYIYTHMSVWCFVMFLFGRFGTDVTHVSQLSQCPVPRNETSRWWMASIYPPPSIASVAVHKNFRADKRRSSDLGILEGRTLCLALLLTWNWIQNW